MNAVDLAMTIKDRFLNKLSTEDLSWLVTQVVNYDAAARAEERKRIKHECSSTDITTAIQEREDLRAQRDALLLKLNPIPLSGMVECERCGNKFPSTYGQHPCGKWLCWECNDALFAD